MPSAGNGCLRRAFNLTHNPPDTIAVAAVQRIAPSSFNDFEVTMRINLHDYVHCLIGGRLPYCSGSQRGVAWSPGARSLNPFCTWSPDKNYDSG